MVWVDMVQINITWNGNDWEGENSKVFNLCRNELGWKWLPKYSNIWIKVINAKLELERPTKKIDELTNIPENIPFRLLGINNKTSILGRGTIHYIPELSRYVHH